MDYDGYGTDDRDSTEQQQHREYLFKILVVGDVGTGKTAIIKRYVHNFFSHNYKATIGVDFALKVINWDANTIIRMQMWDIAGQERFGNMTRVYYKEAAAALVVFDVTRVGTLEGAVRWKTDLDQKVRLADGSPIPSILLANKCDLKESAVTEEDLTRILEETEFAAVYRTSAKENTGIEDACHFLAGHILAMKKAGQYEIALMQKDVDAKHLANGMSGARQTRQGQDDGQTTSKCC